MQIAAGRDLLLLPAPAAPSPILEPISVLNANPGFPDIFEAIAQETLGRYGNSTALTDARSLS